MIVHKAKVRGFICANAHPEGCAQEVQRQIDYVREAGAVDGPKKVLILGASTGYGLATRITAAFASGAATLGVFFERPPTEKRTASAGWYNTVAFEKAAHQAKLYAKSLNGDAFSHELKKQVIDLIKKDLGQVDAVVYSLASPRRTDPDTGEVYQSCLKGIGEAYTNLTVDPLQGTISEVSIPVASEEEIAQTEKVMGGEDWQLWMEALLEAGVLAEGVKTLAYSYIGPELTYAIYHHGTIGRAKAHLDATAKKLDTLLAPVNGRAFISVNKAVVTQASSAIPVVPLYIAILFKHMKAAGTHEDCIAQIHRLFQDRLAPQGDLALDDEGRIRLDDWEMDPAIQAQVEASWKQLNESNVAELADLDAYRDAFYHLFGFAMPGVDYDADVAVDVAMPSLKE